MDIDFNNILCIIQAKVEIPEAVYPTKTKWERKKRCTLPKPSGSEKSGQSFLG